MEYEKDSGPIWIKGGKKYHIVDLIESIDDTWGWALCGKMCDTPMVTTKSPPMGKQCKNCLKVWSRLKEEWGNGGE